PDRARRRTRRSRWRPALGPADEGRRCLCRSAREQCARSFGQSQFLVAVLKHRVECFEVSLAAELQQCPQWVAPLIPASTLIPALPFVVPSSEVSLARIWGLGARQACRFTVVASIVRPRHGADCHGQTSVLVRARSSAERRWIERNQQSALGCFARRRYSDCGADSCRSFYSVGQPTMTRLYALRADAEKPQHNTTQHNSE